MLFFSRVFPYPTICHKDDTLCSFGQCTTSGLTSVRKGSVGEAPRCCYGKVNLPSWCFIVVRRGGHAQGRLLSSAPRRPLPTLPQTRFSRSRRLESSLHTMDPLRHFSSCLGLSSAGVAPLSPLSRKILDETVKTFAVFSLVDVPSRWRRQLHVVRAISYE